jgi:hypothetical protein
MLSERTIRRQLAEMEKRIKAMADYSTHGPKAFESGELYGLRNALAWVMGQDVANPTSSMDYYPNSEERDDR